jgi:hypothetical protein
MIYALIGIPLTFLYLSNIGNFMANCFRIFYKRVCCDILCCEKCDRARRRERLKLRRLREQAVQRNILFGIQPAMVGYSNCRMSPSDPQVQALDVDPNTASTIIPDFAFSYEGGTDAGKPTCQSPPGGKPNDATPNRCSDGRGRDGETAPRCDVTRLVSSVESSIRSTHSLASSRSTLQIKSRHSSVESLALRETAILDDEIESRDPNVGDGRTELLQQRSRDVACLQRRTPLSIRNTSRRKSLPEVDDDWSASIRDRYGDFLSSLADPDQRETDIIHGGFATSDSDEHETSASSSKRTPEAALDSHQSSSFFGACRSGLQTRCHRKISPRDRRNSRSPSPPPDYRRQQAPNGQQHQQQCRSKAFDRARSSADDRIDGVKDRDAVRTARRTKSHPPQPNEDDSRRLLQASVAERQEMTSPSPVVARTSRVHSADAAGRCHRSNNDDDADVRVDRSAAHHDHHQQQQQHQQSVADKRPSPPSVRHSNLHQQQQLLRQRPRSTSGPRRPAVDNGGEGAVERHVQRTKARANWARLREHYRAQGKLDSSPRRTPAASSQKLSDATSRRRQFLSDIPDDELAVMQAIARHKTSTASNVIREDNSGDASGLFGNHPQTTSATSGPHSVNFRQVPYPPMSRQSTRPPVDRFNSLPAGVISRDCTSTDDDSRHCRPEVTSFTSCDAENGRFVHYSELDKPAKVEDNSSIVSEGNVNQEKQWSPNDKSAYDITGRNFNDDFQNVDDGNDGRLRQVSYEFEPLEFDDGSRPIGNYDPFEYEHLSTEHEGKVTVPIVICLIIIAGYIFAGAVLFTLWEDWDYLTGSYFCFITLSTIGFGDIVPGTDMDKWASHEKLVLCALWLAFGLSLLAMCFNLMQEEVKEKCKWIGLRVGLLRDDEQR